MDHAVGSCNWKIEIIGSSADEAWIGGPGIGFGARIGWIDEQRFYFQSEVQAIRTYTCSIWQQEIKKL
jgi:hypothetical protein